MSGSRLRFFVLAGAAYVGLRLAAYLPSSIAVWLDSATYIHVARQPLLSEEFLAGWRPWTVPLFYKVMPDSDTARAAGQLVVSVLCWLALAAAVAWNVRRPRLRMVAFCLVLLFSLSVWITQWDRSILSESLTLSLAAAAVAAWLSLVRFPRAWTVAAVIVTMGLWAFSRDSEASMALMAVPFALAWAILGGRRREAAALTVGLLAITAAVWTAQSAESSAPRRQNALVNVIGLRVLPGSDERRWFIEHGMPLSDRVATLTGGPAKPLPDKPDVSEFVEWVRDEGRQTLITYLLAHPYRTLRPLVDDADLLLAPEIAAREHAVPLSEFQTDGTEPLLPGPLADVAYPPSVTAVVAWFGLLALAAAWLARLGFARAAWLVPGGALILQIPHAAIVWHGDPVGIPRHALSVGVLTRLSLLVLTIFLVEAALEWRQRRG